ncbi:unnamed protein product, partial [Cladocopium goreaui]
GTRAIEFRGLLCCSLAPLLPGSALLGPVQAKYHLGLSNPRLPLARFYCWEDANPHFVPPERSKSKKKHQSDWEQNWDVADYGRSPRSQRQDANWNQRPQSPRQQRHRIGKSGHKGQAKQKSNSKGKGKQETPTANHEGYAAVQGSTRTLPPEPPWNYTAPNMPSLPPMPPPATPHPDLQAAQTLSKLTAVIKKRPDQYDPEVHAILQGAAMIEGLNAKDQMLKAVDDLGGAREALDAARLGQYQNHVRWRDFLASAVTRWQEYTADFQKQEKEFQDAIEQAKMVMANARERFESSKQALSEDDLHAFCGTVAPDDAMTDKAPENMSGKALQENLEQMAANLVSLRTSAEQSVAAEEQAAKRQRVAEGDGFGASAAVQSSAARPPGSGNHGPYVPRNLQSNAGLQTHSMTFPPDNKALMRNQMAMTMQKEAVMKMLEVRKVMTWVEMILTAPTLVMVPPQQMMTSVLMRIRKHSMFTGFHYMRVRLDGLQEAEDAIILQHIHDLAVGSTEKLVVFDIIMHSRPMTGQVPPAPTVVRVVHKVLPQVARRHLLAIAGVDEYCEWVQQQCIVYFNNQPWPLRDTALRDTLHGMYIKILLPPPPTPHWNTAAAVRVAQDVGSLFGFPEAHELASQILEHEYESDPPPVAAPRQSRPCDQEDDIDVPMTFPPGARLPRLRPRHDGNMQWLDQLAEIFRAEAVSEVHGGAPLLYVQTWYVHHVHHARCEAPRPIRLDNAMITWLEEFRFAWRDRWDRRLPFAVHLVLPRPPQPRYQGYACHILFEQAQPPHRVAGVITNLFEGEGHDALQQFATTMPRIVRSADVIDELGLNIFCDTRRCTTTVNGQPLHLIIAQDLNSGFNMCTRIAPPRSLRQLPVPPGDEADEHFADLALLQIVSLPRPGSLPADTIEGVPHERSSSGSQKPRMNADARAFVPGQSHQLVPSAFMQSLRFAWMAAAASWGDEPLSGEILVWFADHSAVVPHGLFPSIFAHVIVIQHAREDWITSLVTLFDLVDTEDEDRFFRRAVTTTEQIYLEHLALAMGYADQCVLRASQFLCLAWHRNAFLRLGQPLQGQNGFGIVIQVRRTPVWRDNELHYHAVPLRSEDAACDLEVSHQTANLMIFIDTFLEKLKPLPGFDLQPLIATVESPEVPAEQVVPLSMEKVRHSFDIYDQIYLLPSYDLAQWADVTTWLDSWWDCQSPISDVWIYHDGSRRAEGVGAAAVAFVRQCDKGWLFGGAVSIALDAEVTSYGAELRGGILAVQFGIDILKIATIIQPEAPSVCLLHDNTAVGNQIIGNWNAHADFCTARLARHLLVYAEHRFGKKWTSHYTAAHRGDIGNEIADTLAGDAAEGRPLSDLQQWQDVLFDPSFATHAAWFWTFYSEAIKSWWRNGDICLPLEADGPPAADVLPDPSTITECAETATFDCTFGTCNVLTLRSAHKADDGDLGLTGPTRQQIVFQQFRDTRTCIFALQETRLRQCSKTLLDYLVFKGDATPQGHHGVLIAISTVIPYGYYTDRSGQQHDLCFTAQDVSLVVATARYVILRLKTPWLRCVLIAGHAPHSGYALSEIEAWRAALSDAIPLVLRVWTRNDYIALPTAWPATSCQSWLPDDIDVSLHHEDHRAALVRLHMDLQKTTTARHHSIQKLRAETADLGPLRNYAPIAPGLDVHSQARQLQEQIVACLPRSTSRGPTRLKKTMSDETWSLVLAKRQWRSALREANDLQRSTCLQILFANWRMAVTPDHQELQPVWPHDGDRILADQDKFIAKALHEFRNLGRLVTKSSRADDVRFFQEVLAEGAQFLQPHQSRDLWKTIKKALPKYRQRRIAVDPLKIMALEEEWNPHFTSLEAGCILDPSHLLAEALRIAGRTAAAKNLSFGVLFVDLTTAFHCLIREMVVGIGDHDKLQYVMEALAWSSDAQQRIQLGQALPCLLEQLGAPAYLVRLMRNIHDSTWTTVNGHDTLRTHRGTRPGSPLADAIFHYIMYDFSLELKKYLDTQGHTTVFATHLDMDIDMVIWSDDLAVPILTVSAEELVPQMLQLLDFVQVEFAKRGFILNLAKGKTGIVATFGGPGSAAMRKRFQLTPQAAFDQIRRRILANRRLPLPLRLQLFRSLILSKLYFAVGSWHTPTGRQIAKLRNAVARMVKIVYGPALPTKSTSQLLTHAGVLDPRAKIAVERLAYAQRVFHHGPAFLQLMVHAEAEQHEHSWLVGLQYDMQWMHGVEAEPDPMLLDEDLTLLIDYWQRDQGRWKSRVRRAAQRHLYQEAMMHEVQQWHADIFKILRNNAFTFQPDPLLDALPAAGPYGCGPPARDKHLAELRARKLALETEFFDYVQPQDSEGAGERLGDLLSATTWAWFRDFEEAHHRIDAVEKPQDRWLDVLCRLPAEFESWTARVFILWGRHLLPDIIGNLFDGAAEAYLDAEYADLAAEFDEFWLEGRLQALDRQLAAAMQPPPPAEPHRPVRPPQRDARPRSVPLQVVPRLFHDQEKWHQDLERVQWQDLPSDPYVPYVRGLQPRPTFIIVHLFA